MAFFDTAYKVKLIFCWSLSRVLLEFGHLGPDLLISVLVICLHTLIIFWFEFCSFQFASPHFQACVFSATALLLSFVSNRCCLGSDCRSLHYFTNHFKFSVFFYLLVHMRGKTCVILALFLIKFFSFYCNDPGLDQTCIAKAWTFVLLWLMYLLLWILVSLRPLLVI
mgnify:CR=1 FL=1